MAQFITDVFSQVSKKWELLCAWPKEKHNAMASSWSGMLQNERVFLLRSVILCFFVSFLFSVACTACGEAAVPFVRIDRDKLNAWKDELDNVRLLADQRYKFKKVNPKYRFDPDYKPSTEGLDTLCISGSAQFSGPQFRRLASVLRKCAKGKDIYVIDLRQESHVLVNEGIPLSWYGSHNWANEGKTLKEIEADEAERFGAMIGRTINAYARKDDTPVAQMAINIKSVMTEKELVESEAFKYVRIPVQDHIWPPAEDIDAFISFVNRIGPGQAWLHFHCHAGKGRTSIMMIIYDMMRNPGVPMKDIAVRQTMVGGSYPLYTEKSGSYKVPLYEEKARMLPLIYEYVQENRKTNYKVPWSLWLKKTEKGT
jgi:hypothetical protein